MKCTISTALAVAILTGCASGPSPVSREVWQQRADDSLKVEQACAKAKVADVDDGDSDPYAVALVLSAGCMYEYNRFTEAFAMAKMDNDAQVRMFRERSATRSARIDNFLQYVLAYRKSLKNLPK